MNPAKFIFSCLLFILVNNTVFSQITYPTGMYADTAHAPFYHGVASGDPLPSGVIIWTRITPDSTVFTPLNVNYQIAADSSFTTLIQTGNIITDSAVDWTVKIDVSGLLPNTIYYYRFNNGLGNYSAIGRTRTAPSGSVAELKFAVFSCSSVFSGFFNGYARVADKADSLHAAIHLGDYIYDFVDGDEEVRVPSPYPTVPNTLEGWRNRHEYYLMDPDLRKARAALPWICIWDNHDQDCGGNYACTFTGGNKAYLEWLPVRVPDSTQMLNLYRTINYGNLADIIMADVLMYRHTDTLPNGEYNMMGNSQFNWLEQELTNSTAKWKIVAQQRMIGGWYTNGIPAWVLAMLPNAGAIFDDGSWDGFPASKARLFNFVRTHFIDNMIVLSGDAHVSIAQDLIEDPFNTSMYDAESGTGSVGVEFLPTSISRGNMDESGAPIDLFATINNVDRMANPQHQFADLYNHGYGILHLKNDSTIAQFWYSHILEQDLSDSLGATLVVKDGENHWSRNSGFSSIVETLNSGFSLFPNPANNQITLHFKEAMIDETSIEVIDALGKVYLRIHAPEFTFGNMHQVNIETLPAGLYFVRVGNKFTRKFIKN